MSKEIKEITKYKYDNWDYDTLEDALIAKTEKERLDAFGDRIKKLFKDAGITNDDVRMSSIFDLRLFLIKHAEIINKITSEISEHGR